MDVLIFRKAKQQDLQVIIQLLAGDELGKLREKTSVTIDSSYQRAFDQINADSQQFLMVVEEDQKVIGTCHLTWMPSLTFQGALRLNIEAVRIANDCRGRGIGEKMIQHAIQMARDKGCKIIQLTTNKQRNEAKKFYERLGFKASHEGMKMYLEHLSS